MKTNVAIAALLGLTSAREPLLAKDASPLLVHQKPAYSDYDVDYFVPDFGMAHEMRYTQDSIKQAEQQFGHEIKADWKDTAAPGNPRDYFVPHFGVDEDIKNTKSDIELAESQIGHKMVADFSLKDGVPRNYPVADFGVDQDIATSLQNSATWNPTPGDDGSFSMPSAQIEFKL